MNATTFAMLDRKSTRLNSSHTEIYTLSLHDALPICLERAVAEDVLHVEREEEEHREHPERDHERDDVRDVRSEEHTSELQSHRDLHSFPTRRSSDLPRAGCSRGCSACRARGRRTSRASRTRP